MNNPGTWFLGFGAFCFMTLGGCATGPSTAFPTAQEAASAEASGGADVSTLALGRRIFTTSCTECHVARPVARFSVEQWRKIVGVMAPRARLSATDRSALEAYLIAARKSVPQS